MITAQEAREMIPTPFISDEELFAEIKMMAKGGNDFTYRSLTDEQANHMVMLGYKLEDLSTDKKPNYYRISW